MDLRDAEAGAIRHPWETSRFDFFHRLLTSTNSCATTVLDVGAGDAWFSSELARRSDSPLSISCFDINAPIERRWRVGASELEQVRTQPQRRYALVLLMDVLEHVPEPVGFLTRILDQNLEPGGRVLISVPAWPALWTQHDEYLGHHRRYTPKTGRELLDAAGLRALQSGGLFHSLLLPRGLAAMAERARAFVPGRRSANASQAGWHHGALFTGVVNAALKADTLVGRTAAGLGLELPGLSWWALCSK